MRGSMIPKVMFVLCFALLSGATASATIFFSEDFNSYASDADMIAAGWTTNTLDQLPAGDPMKTTTPPNEGAYWTLAIGGNGPHGGRANPIDRHGNNTTGNYIISDSDAAPSNDNGTYDIGYVLETPAINCAGATAVYLHFASFICLNDNGWAVFEVWVSPDNGATWQMVEQRIAPSRGSPPYPDENTVEGIVGTVDYDISSVAAGQAQVKIRFVQRGCDDDWFCEIDDIFVDDSPPPLGSTVLLPAESFLSGSIPGTWTVTTNCGDNPWHVHDPTRPGERPHISEAGGVAGPRVINRLDTTFAILDSDQDPDNCNDVEFLDTPPIDASGMSMVFLDFDSEIVTYAAASEQVLLSVDGGTTFLPDPVWTYDNVARDGEDPKYTHHRIPVPQAAGHNNVVFRFSYLGNGNSWYWAVDNIRVTGEVTGYNPPSTPTIVAQPSYTLADAQAGIPIATTPYDDGGQGMTHIRTEFQVRTAKGDYIRPLISDAVSSGDLTQFVLNGLIHPGDFYVRARHVALGGGIEYPSAWSTEQKFTVEPPPNTLIMLSEDFDSLAGQLQSAVDETGIPPNVLGFTHNPPGGWVIDNSNMEMGGTEEWKGWSFVTMDFWLAADTQQRGNFTWSSGVFAVADSDEYDDYGPGPTGFDSILISRPISVPPNSAVYVFYTAHYRQEDPAIGEFRVSVEGNETLIKRYDVETQNTPEFFTIPSEPNTRLMYFVWEYFSTEPDHRSRNNWFFAIDNVEVYVESVGQVLSVRNTWPLYR